MMTDPFVPVKVARDLTVWELESTTAAAAEAV